MISADGGLDGGLAWSALLVTVAMARHSSTRRENLARHPVRSAILGTVAAGSGLVLSDLRRRVGCSAGTIQHHLRHLERCGLVTAVSLHHRHWIFPAGVPPETCLGLALLQSGRAWDLAQSLARAPGQAQRDLARGLAASRRAVREQVARLVRHGLALAVPHGRSARYFPTDRLLGLLAVRGFGPSAAVAEAVEAVASAAPAPVPAAAVPVVQVRGQPM